MEAVSALRRATIAPVDEPWRWRPPICRWPMASRWPTRSSTRPPVDLARSSSPGTPTSMGSPTPSWSVDDIRARPEHPSGIKWVHGHCPGPPPAAPPAAPKTAVSAVEMGARQREISVSEFFTKNRHLLGFDNPRKALLTCVKEAVDNALDASEEAGILPDVVVHARGRAEQRLAAAAGQPGHAVPRHRRRQRARHRPAADSADLRQAPLRLEVPPAAHEPRPAGHRHLGRRHVRAAHDRQAGADHLAHRRARARPTTSRCRSTPRRTSRGSSRARRSTGRSRAAPR